MHHISRPARNAFTYLFRMRGKDTVCKGAYEAEMIEDPVVAFYLDHRNNAAVDPSLEDPAEKGLKRVHAN